MVRSGLLGSSA